jgi:hypothetical protein
LFDGVSWFWGLTCDFWAENGKRKMAARVKAIHSVVSAFCRDGAGRGFDGKGSKDGGWLRVSGFFAALRMTAEAKSKTDPLRG